jgi:hypothetical protein
MFSDFILEIQRSSEFSPITRLIHGLIPTRLFFSWESISLDGFLTQAFSAVSKRLFASRRNWVIAVLASRFFAVPGNVRRYRD